MRKKDLVEDMTDKADIKEDSISEEWDILHIDKIKNIE